MDPSELGIESSFEMRYVFQSSPDIIGVQRPTTFVDFDYGKAAGEDAVLRRASKVHRLMATFALGMDQGAGGMNFWYGGTGTGGGGL